MDSVPEEWLQNMVSNGRLPYSLQYLGLPYSYLYATHCLLQYFRSTKHGIPGNETRSRGCKSRPDQPVAPRYEF